MAVVVEDLEEVLYLTEECIYALDECDETLEALAAVPSPSLVGDRLSSLGTVASARIRMREHGS